MELIHIQIVRLVHFNPMHFKSTVTITRISVKWKKTVQVAVTEKCFINYN